MQLKNHLIPIVILLMCILIFSFTFFSTMETKTMIPWAQRSLTWEDFELVDDMDDDYVAMIYSDIKCPELITTDNSKVYAFMNPNRSERLEDEYDSYNVLIHEQYHFNITEYCARLLRKDIVELGLDGLSYETMKSLKSKYSTKLDSLQTVYDNITDHNANSQLQRFWELQIDDWLRQTSYYKNEDIYSYYNFTKNRTTFFKDIYFTLTQKILTSYPVGEDDLEFGETYEVSYVTPKERLVKFYKNGELTNGGYFKTAITRIVKKAKDLFEVHYYNPDETYNSKLDACLRKIEVDENENKVETYYNEKKERVYRNSVFEIQWTYDAKHQTYYSTYLNEARKTIANEDGVFHEKRSLDEKERSFILENFDANHKLKNNKEYIARFEVAYDDNNQRVYNRMYDENKQYALHLSDYHLAYEYDERGRTSKVISLDTNGNKTYDHNGASIYEYTYDRYDRQISEKRFNTDEKPIIANDDYFQKVVDYDSIGRPTFKADYYPGYVLRFSDKKDGASKYSYENDTIKKIYNVDAYNDVYANDYQVAITIQTLNSKKQVIKEVYLDADENFAKTDDESVIYRYQYDAMGNQIQTAAYDSLNAPKEFEADVATIRWKYDDKGNKLKTTYYNKNDDLANATDNVTYNMYHYDKTGYLNQRYNYDIEMKPSEIDGTYRTQMHKNKIGLDSIIFAYNSNNKLKNGVAITRHAYNKYGKLTRLEYFDAQNRRTKNQDGVSAINYNYDRRQLLVGYKYYDTYNRLTNNTSGIALEKWEMDELVHTLSYTFFDKNRNPAIGESGYYKVEYEWDDMGQTTKTTTYGTNNELIEDTYGTASYAYTLAPSGMIQIIERYNKENELANNSDKVAVSHYQTRLNGLYYLEKELNAAGEVVNDTIVE